MASCAVLVDSTLKPLERAADDYLDTVAAEDGTAVCSRMTRVAQTEFAAA